MRVPLPVDHEYDYLTLCSPRHALNFHTLRFVEVFFLRFVISMKIVLLCFHIFASVGYCFTQFNFLQIIITMMRMLMTVLQHDNGESSTDYTF